MSNPNLDHNACSDAVVESAFGGMFLGSTEAPLPSPINMAIDECQNHLLSFGYQLTPQANRGSLSLLDMEKSIRDNLTTKITIRYNPGNGIFSLSGYSSSGATISEQTTLENLVFRILLATVQLELPGSVKNSN